MTSTHQQQTDNDWRRHAACRTVDPELFYPTAQSGPAHWAQVAAAKAVCAGCPVQDRCLSWAMESLPHGIAGGLTETERTSRRDTGQRRAHRSARRAVCAARPVAATPTENAAAGREALRAGSPAAKVAAEFGVTVRTAERWAQRVRAENAHMVRAGR
jgi:hypothetical protein